MDKERNISGYFVCENNGSLSAGFLNDVDYPTVKLGDEDADRRRSRPTGERHSHPTIVRAGEQG